MNLLKVFVAKMFSNRFTSKRSRRHETCLLPKKTKLWLKCCDGRRIT